MTPILVERIDALLPQTQCTRCGYDGCLPYAQAVADGEAINRCPPGGEETIAALAEVTGRSPLPLDPVCGTAETRAVSARIVEADCIGCFKCIQACPVDAIVGAPKLMHTVIDAECTGCELCVPVCPVDCIEMQPSRSHVQPARFRAAHSRARYLARQQRLDKARREQDERRRRRAEEAAKERRVAGYLAAARERAQRKAHRP